MHRETLDDADPPPIPIYSSTRPFSRTPARPRQVSPPNPQWMNRTPQDILQNPASPDVISNLLDSFHEIHSPEPSDSNHLLPPGLRTPARSTRQSSKAPTPRQSISPSRAPPPTTHRFVEEVQHPVEDIAELPPEEDAAEPPVVRTSRPPSGLSRGPDRKAQRKTKSRFAPSPQSLSTPPPERIRAPPRPSTDVNSLRSGYQSPSLASLSRRDSLDSTRSRESFQKRFWRLTSRNKKQDIYSSSTASLRGAVNDSQRAGRTSSSVQTPLYRSVVASARLSEDDGEDAEGMGMSEPRLQAVQERVSPPSMRAPPSSFPKALRSPSPASNDLVPDRISSSRGRDTAASPVIVKAAPHANDSLVTAGQPVESSGRQRLFIKPEEDDDENKGDDQDETDVMKRIKELKAARDERRKSLKDQTSEIPPNPPTPSPRLANGSFSPVQGNPPDTALASRQLAEADQVEEHKIPNGDSNGTDPYVLDVPPTPTPQYVTLKPRPGGEISKERAFIVDSVVSTTRSTARPSLDSPNLSSKKQGKSPGSSPIIPLPGSPKGQHQKNRFSFSKSLPVPEVSGRPSLDAINASVREFLAAPRLSQQVPFPADGRKISFSEVGDPNGYVVFCCVGMGLTRYIMAYYDELATSLKLRLITPDRPGIGDSEPCTDDSDSPFNWPDDVQVICAKLGITKFSILAHSAGVIYALATALRMSQFLRGKIHLLAPWIPPSQLTNTSAAAASDTPTGALPRSQRFLRMLPTSFLKLSNSSLAGLTRNNTPKTSPGRGRKSSEGAAKQAPVTSLNPLGPGISAPRLAPRANTRPPTPHLEDVVQIPSGQDFAESIMPNGKFDPANGKERQRMYDAALTPAIWELATRNANPAVDLIICLERTKPIGFRYADVGSKPARNVHDGFVDEPGSQWPGYGIIIHHGSKDTRVPIENVKWLGKIMPQAEVRVLEGQGHGLMATGGVMGSVLTEIGKEWEKSNWV